jgi:hypothetical protein
VEKYGTARQATDDVIQRMKDIRIHTLMIFDTYCFSMATTVTRTHIVTLCVRGLYCSSYRGTNARW